jgi:hypothetical protein
MKKVKTTHPKFIPGLKLAEDFFRDAVSPILKAHMSALEYSAALIGSGSDVLGFDDAMSMDHDWGPRAMLFLNLADFKDRKQEISGLLERHLPLTFKGHSTNWTSPDPNDGGTKQLQFVEKAPVNHRIELYAINSFFEQYLGIDLARSMQAKDWLILPWQKLRAITSGKVFRDDLRLDSVCQQFSGYPDDVWRYILASCWSRIGEEEHLTGRAGMAGDEIGSSIIASRLIRDLMRLAFLMERVYPPYPKWFGSAFRELQCAETLLPLIAGVLGATTWQKRDAALSPVYQALATMHNALEITPPLSSAPVPFFGRPFTVIQGARFSKALRDTIRDDTVKSIAEKRLIGNIDLVSDNTDLLEAPSRLTALRALYE